MDLREALLRHWPLKLAALALSVLLWAGVASQEVTSQLVAVHLELDWADTLDLTRPLPSVTALVTGPGREILKLYSTGPAYQQTWFYRHTPVGWLRTALGGIMTAILLAVARAAGETSEAAPQLVSLFVPASRIRTTALPKCHCEDCATKPLRPSQRFRRSPWQSKSSQQMDAS